MKEHNFVWDATIHTLLRVSSPMIDEEGEGEGVSKRLPK